MRRLVALALTLTLALCLVVPMPILAGEPLRAQAAQTESPGIVSVEVDGFTIEVESAGRGEVTVLFEAGGGWGLSTWDPIFDQAAALARVIRYSRVGFGDSSVTDRRWTSQEYAEHAARLLDKLRVSEPVVLVGHSYGADVARHFAANFQDRTQALLLIDPASEHDVDLMRAIDLERANREIEQIKAADLEAELFAPIIYDIWAKFPKPDYPEIGDIPVTVLASVRKHEDPQLLFFEDEAREAWGALHRKWAETFPRGRAVLTEQSGHFIHADEPGLVIEELHGLLERLESSQSSDAD